MQMRLYLKEKQKIKTIQKQKMVINLSSMPAKDAAIAQYVRVQDDSRVKNYHFASFSKCHDVKVNDLLNSTQVCLTL